MANFKKQLQPIPLQKDLTLKQDFSYKKGTTTLNFTLTLDSKTVADFKECLQEALKDITELEEK